MSFPSIRLISRANELYSIVRFPVFPRTCEDVAILASLPYFRTFQDISRFHNAPEKQNLHIFTSRERDRKVKGGFPHIVSSADLTRKGRQFFPAAEKMKSS